MSKRISVLALVIIFSITIIVGCQQNSIPQTGEVEISAGNVGAALHAFASGWSSIINTKSGIRATVVATGGSLENLRRLGDKDADAGYVITPQVAEAYGFLGEYAKDNLDYKDLRSLYTYHYGGLSLTVLENSGIKKIEDLRGKRVVLGAPGSAGSIYLERILKAHELELTDFEPEYLTTSAGATALQDGSVDCLGLLVPAPISALMEVSSFRTIRLLPLEEAGMDKFISDNPGWTKGEYDPTVYHDVASTDPVPSLFTSITVASHKDVPEDTVYEIVKVLWDNIDEFHNAHATAPDVMLDKIFETMAVPLHPGAIKYYKEVGLEVPSEFVNES